MNLIGAVLWALIIGFLGYLCGHVLQLIMGEIKHLEVPILIGVAVIGGLWIFYHHRRRGKGFKWTTILRTQLLHWAGLLR